MRFDILCSYITDAADDDFTPYLMLIISEGGKCGYGIFSGKVT